MKNKVCIILCYFGKFPDTMPTFLKGCRNNPDFNWLIFSDCGYDNLPDNVQIVKTTLADVKKLATEKIGISLCLEAPYKLCDFKVAYGLIFEDYIKDYDFWGYGDMDVLYGNLSKFISDELLDEYDKIYPLGHLSLLRNNEKCVKLFMADVPGTTSYKDALAIDDSFFFDEDKGINDKAEALGLKIYSKFDFADIDGVYKKFRNVSKFTLKMTLPSFKYLNELRKNYKYQVFFSDENGAYQRHVNGKKTVDEDVSYIHYRRKLANNSNVEDKYIIVNQYEMFSSNNSPTVDEIKSMNYGRLKQMAETVSFFVARVKMRAPAVVKDKTIGFFGQFNGLRKIVRALKGSK